MTTVNSKNKIQSYFLSPKNTPAPADPKNISKYYVNFNDIVVKVSKLLKKNIKIKRLSFEQSVLWPKITINEFL